MAPVIPYLKTLTRIRFKQLAIQNPFSKKRQDYTKFIILTTPRTGSTLLHTYLNYHLNVFSLGEQFNRKEAEIYWLAYPQLIKAVGFKVFYNLFTPDDISSKLEQMCANHEVKIIWLRRRNKLRQWVSLKLSQATGEWTWTAKRLHPLNNNRELSPNEFLNFVAHLEKFDATLQSFLKSKTHMTLFYEDLDEQPELEMKKIWQFLGVANTPPVSLLKKQHPQPLEVLLKNDEVFLRTGNQKIIEWMKD